MLDISPVKIKDNLDSSELYSMSMMHSHRFGRTVAKVVIFMFLLFFVVIFLPWQQNIFSTEGSVTALYPEDRPQTIEATIAGRIQKWHVHEGQHIKKGMPIVTISEVKDKYFDPELIIRLNEQLNSKREVIEATERKNKAIRNQIEALNNAFRYSIEKAKNKILQAKLKNESDSVNLIAEKINYQVALEQFNRSEKMYEQGLIPLTELERRKLKFQETNAKLISTENKFLESKNELINAKIELSSIEADYNDKISKAESDFSSSIAYLANSEGDYSKLKNEVANVKIRNQNYVITATQNGYIVKTMRAGIGETLKEGDPVALIMSENPTIATELYVYPMDVPLLSKGRQVRLEFDGWPALQVSGWPSVAVGTFGGRVEVIDRVQSDNGKFRILVVPDEHDEPWPDKLRIGSGVKGWAMLDEVPIWYDIWRQLNGFPPSLKEKPSDTYSPDTKKKKKIK
ncbi:MAG: biotin/lipoyl-binding protein [Cytophagales bacterium]